MSAVGLGASMEAAVEDGRSGPVRVEEAIVVGVTAGGGIAVCEIECTVGSAHRDALELKELGKGVPEVYSSAESG